LTWLAAESIPKPEILTIPVDLGSFQSLIQYGENLRSLGRIDAAILNAGVDLKDFSLTEGFETTITVNLISTFFLATLLQPQLRESSENYQIQTHIAVVGSFVHYIADPKELTTPPEGQILTTLSDPKQVNMKGRYPASKLGVMLLVGHLAKLAQSKAKSSPSVIINNVAPGFCKTNLFRNEGLSTRIALKLIGRSSEHGARTLVHGAVAGEESHGQYLSECQVKKASPFVRGALGAETGARLWKELETIYEQQKPGCTAVWHQ
jgi:NAD(P)-dependent dehydrogenase (short-subunit alcohol dehydrogenase family)